jgi:hypothetical protein
LTKTASEAPVELSRSASWTRCAETTDDELHQTSTPELRAEARTSRGRIDPPQATAARTQTVKRISIHQSRRRRLLRIKNHLHSNCLKSLGSSRGRPIDVVLLPA